MDLSVSVSPEMGHKHAPPHMACLQEFCRFNSGSHACEASTPHTEWSPLLFPHLIPSRATELPSYQETKHQAS